MKTKFRTRVTRKIRRIIATGIVIAALLVPFKAKAEELEEKAQEPRKPFAAKVFTQYRKGDGLGAGFGLFGTPKLGPITLGLGSEFSGDLNSGTGSLETAHLSVSGPIYGPLSVTAYAQASRFLGGQKATGGVLHLELESVTIHAGAERDVGGPVPLFAWVDIPIGAVTISPKAILPVNVPGQDHPKAGGHLQVALDLGGTTVFVRGILMTDPENPKEPKVLAANGQVGVNRPF